MFGNWQPASLSEAATHLPLTKNAMNPRQDFQALRQYLSASIIGQPGLVEHLLVALLADGHLLVEGAPGLAKTRAIRALALAIAATFHRIQFTPDLLPSDITGSDIYRPQTGVFEFQPGPVFNNLVLADEINRAPAKVQSALLEAMAERQVTIGNHTHAMPALFMVMATQNPIEQEGTWPLPEAQLDRFLMHVRVDWPDAAAERDILRLNRAENDAVLAGGAKSTVPLLTQETLRLARREALSLRMADSVEEYLVQLVVATRTPERFDAKMKGMIAWGASPRATLAIDRAARAQAWLDGRDFVTPSDVQSVAADCLRHRIGLAFEAEAAGETADRIVRRILAAVPAP